MNWARKPRVTPVLARTTMFPPYRQEGNTLQGRNSLRACNVKHKEAHSMTQQAERVSGPERRTAQVIYYNLSYIVQGAEHGTDGAIVLLHDMPAGAFSWAGVMPQLAATGRSVYAIDMLGYGQSDFPWPADTSNWGQGDALAYLFEQLNLTNIILVGHGFGGAVAQVLATRLVRERVTALALIDTT